MDWAETILAGVCVVCMTLLGIDLYKFRAGKTQDHAQARQVRLGGHL